MDSQGHLDWAARYSPTFLRRGGKSIWTSDRSFKGHHVAGRRRRMMPFWVLTQKLYRIAHQLLKVVVAKSGPTM